MKKDTSHTLQRAEHFQLVLIAEGLLVGIVAGTVVMAYRVALQYAGEWLSDILRFIQESSARTAGWFLILLFFALITGKLLTWEPLISGSGIPQLEGEMVGKLDPCWWKILTAKFAGGFLCLLGGLSLGREGPSIQLGAMAGKGFSRLTRRGLTEERFLLTCGASAGLAAAFHAPLAGVMFSLEEVHKNFSVSALLSVMTASLTADYLSSNIVGFDPVFQFDLMGELPVDLYWTLLVLGAVLGVLGAFYNRTTLKAQAAFRKLSSNAAVKLVIPFALAGILGLTMPSLLGSGHEIVNSLTGGEMTLLLVLGTLAGKFLFSVICFGSGAPGGIFFPLLVLGALIGGAFGMAGVEFFGMDPSNINNYVLLAMAGFFTAIVRAPLTGIILLFEMTGTVSQMLSLSIVSIAAYIVATLLRSEPIYESLLKNLLKGRGQMLQEDPSERVLMEIAVHQESILSGRKVGEVSWPENCLLVAVQRNGAEIIPRGSTRLQTGDLLIIMTPASGQGRVYDQVKSLCSGAERHP